MEIMVINELRLDFMNPRSGSILEQHMREFLGLPEPTDRDA
jgi:Fe-S cluster biosynthesis and repair protein YggX